MNREITGVRQAWETDIEMRGGIWDSEAEFLELVWDNLQAAMEFDQWDGITDEMMAWADEHIEGGIEEMRQARDAQAEI